MIQRKTRGRPDWKGRTSAAQLPSARSRWWTARARQRSRWVEEVLGLPCDVPVHAKLGAGYLSRQINTRGVHATSRLRVQLHRGRSGGAQRAVTRPLKVKVRTFVTSACVLLQSWAKPRASLRILHLPLAPSFGFFLSHHPSTTTAQPIGASLSSSPTIPTRCLRL